MVCNIEKTFLVSASDGGVSFCSGRPSMKSTNELNELAGE